MTIEAQPPCKQQCLTQNPYTFVEIGGSGGVNFNRIFQYLGDSKLSFVCKAMQRISNNALAAIIPVVLNKEAYLELPLLRDIQTLRPALCTSSREYINKVKLVFSECGLSAEEKHRIKELFLIQMGVERGLNKYLSSKEKMEIPHGHVSYDHVRRFVLLADMLKVKQDQQDDALRKLASELKKQIPTIPERDVNAIRTWLDDAQNHDFILSISRVDLIHQELEVIPAEITAFVNLEELNLSENTIAEIPPEIGSLVNLEGLYLGGNQITEIPPEMGALVNLEELNLSENKIAEIPPEICALVNLERLDLSKNEISVIPTAIATLLDLEDLYLGGNQITEIPPEMGALVNLIELCLGDNQIIKIPPEMSALDNLVWFELDNNQITEIPPEIKVMRDCIELSLDGNSIV